MTIINNRFGEVTDVIGIGIGPFNLSIAALLEPLKTIKYHFFDQNEQFSWHPGMLLPGSEIQVSHLKDLVTLVDPSNSYSFLSFLAKNKRLYRFINARFPRVQRSEFNQYLKWACESIKNLHFREKVERIEYIQNSKLFLMQTTRRMIKSKHLILGNGLSANIPVTAKPFLGDNVFHCKDYLHKKQNFAGKNVVVIGGGQSGAEIINAILSDGASLPDKLTWVTRRQQFSPIDDSPGANELFSPNHSTAFYQLSADKKEELLNQHILASDGISQYLLENIYQKLYNLEFLEERGRFYDFLPNHSLSTIHQNAARYSLTFVNKEFDIPRVIDADIIILCTGFQNYLPTYLTPLMDHIPLKKGKFIVNSDYSVAWNGPNENRIYVQNSARHSHGIADPNLSLMAYRSAKIINSISENNIYDLDCVSDSIDWSDIYATSHTSQEKNAYVERYY